MSIDEPVKPPSETCIVCEQSFVAMSYSELNKKLYNHGVEEHIKILRMASREADRGTDPIWAADYIAGRGDD